VPFGEVLGRDHPAPSHTDHDRPQIVDAERDQPDRHALAPVEEPGADEQRGAEDRCRRESEKRAAAVGIVANDDRGEDEMKEAYEEVRGPEQHGVVSEGARYCQGDAEHRAHRRKHDQAYPSLVDIDRARQPRVHAPPPPQSGEDEHPAQDSTPRRVVREQDCDLGHREHEGQVEEELERGDLALGVMLVLEVRHVPTLAQVQPAPVTPERRVVSSRAAASCRRHARSSPSFCRRRRRPTGRRRPGWIHSSTTTLRIAAPGFRPARSASTRRLAGKRAFARLGGEP
jgi:hypothetical protein